MSKVTGIGFSADSFFDQLADQLQTTFAADTAAVDIVDFVENVIDKEAWGIKLDRRQLLILKVYYGVDLDDDDLAILEAWGLEEVDRTTFNVQDFLEDGPCVYQSLILECGRRGGKTLIGAIIIAYEFYKLCLLPSPQKHYEIAANTPIVIYCIATVAEQTKKTIYGQARALLYFVPLLRKLIDSKEIIVGETEVKYPAKLLFIFSGNSKSAGQVGSSVILLVMDEVARFRSEQGESNALELWSNIGISGLTFGEDGKRVAISSAWEEEDAIQKLYNTCKDVTVRTSFIGFRLRSWDLNPKHASRDHPLVRAEYASNAYEAALEFEGIRYSSQNAFLDPMEVRNAFRGGCALDGVTSDSSSDELVKINLTKLHDGHHPVYIHLDPAVKRDAYGLAMGHAERNEEGETIVIIDGLIAWEPTETKQVSITNVQSAIYEIHRRRVITKVTSDHQHSPETIQRLRANGINAESIYFSRSIQMEMYDCLRKLLHEKRIVFPRTGNFSPMLQDELVNLLLIQGDKITHRPDKSKDLADCVAAIAWHIIGKQTSGWTSSASLVIPKKTTAGAVTFSDSFNESFLTNRSSYRKEVLKEKVSWDTFFTTGQNSRFSSGE